MSRESSPLPSSDDSAVGSIGSGAANSESNSNNRAGSSSNGNQAISAQENGTQPKTHPARAYKPMPKCFMVSSDDLEKAAKQMRSNNVSLVSRSIRTILSCFDDLDVQRFETRTDYLINFISNGINKCSTSILRPVSILWPESYEKMVEQLSILDAFLLNTEFREKPVDWMLKRGLTFVPICRHCKDKMELKYESNSVRWQCQKSQACSNYLMPVQRPSFFSNYENVGLDKLLFCVYYWSTCTPGEELYAQMNIQPQILNGIWRRIQNVCRTALEKSYPRHRLTNVVDHGQYSQNPPLPIDLVSIKLNDVFIICAKHPNSNLVRLGLYIPGVSLYSYVDLTESWFAHGAQIRVSESKFLDLAKRRTDLTVQLVPRLQMISKDGHFYRESAFGYLICQLSHVFKDFDSSSLTRESLKLILAEMQWRELYGTTPFDAFTNIINHMAQYGETSQWYSEPSLSSDTREVPDDQISQSLNGTEYVWAEKHFYATRDPIDNQGKVICRFTESSNLENPPLADVRIRCHICNFLFESFQYSIHIIAHVEAKRKEHERKEYLKKKLIECKHCFKTFKREQITMHSTLFRAHFHTVQYGCRICCIKFDNRPQFLQHMRRIHFEHETPYRCPTCKFASSFQRDVFIHFQEEHRHSMIVLCPLCLRSFTVSKPETMTPEKMSELSKIVYNHIAEHYITSKSFTCGNCCLCFLEKEKLLAHKRIHHNPLEVLPLDQVKITPFIVTREEEKYSVKALPIELYIPNQRPNIALHAVARDGKSTNSKQPPDGDNLISSSSSDSSSEDEGAEPAQTNATKQTKNQQSNEISDVPKGSPNSCSDDDSFCTAIEDGTIYVRGLKEADKFLDGGGPALTVSKCRNSSAGRPVSLKNDNPIQCSSQRLINFLSKMNKADGIIANQSVILTPRGKPAKCCECLEYVTVDHFVALIDCRDCKYSTHCPRAATLHRKDCHQPADV